MTRYLVLVRIEQEVKRIVKAKNERSAISKVKDAICAKPQKIKRKNIEVLQTDHD